MKKKHLYGALLWAFLVTAALTTGCSDDNDYPDVDGQNPTISLTTEHIQSEIGRTFTLAGKVADKDGIRSIRLRNAELYLDKTIDLLAIYKEPVYDYNLSYEFTTPKTQTGDNFTIKVTVTDLGGRSVESDVLLTMDGDFTAPVFTAVPDASITVLIKDNTKLNLRFTTEDDKALDYVAISIPEINFNETLQADGKTLSYNKAISLPSDAATYNLTITSVDKFQLSTTKTCVINVSEMPDFSKMYLTDVKTVDQLNSDLFGIPMLIEHSAPYTYTAHYYSEVAGTEVRFLPQKTDFSPICFGINPNNSTVLTDEPDISLPIVLAEKGYYEITFNVQTGEYTANRYTPTDTPLSNVNLSLAGKGLPGVGEWSPANPLMLTQDTDNPYLFYAEMNLETGTEIEFTITPKHDQGWWVEPFFRFESGEFDSKENEYNTKNNGNNLTPVTVQKAGKYMFKFDSHLLRSRFYPIN